MGVDSTTQPWISSLLIIFGFIVTCATIPLVKRLGLKYGFVSTPGGRRYHESPTPTLGGAAIYIPFTIVFICYICLRLAGIISSQGPDLPRLLSLFLGVSWILLLGIIDDRGTLGWNYKLLGQVLGVVILALGGHTIAVATIPFIGPVDFGWMGIPLLMVGVIVITNAVNLVDGLDGLAGGICFFAALTSATIAVFKADVFTASVEFTIAGALLGFLMFNFPPASIFLGDGGSMMMGFLLATLATSSAAMQPGQRFGTSVMILVPVLPFGVPLFEVALSVFRRWIKGQAIFLGDANHLHHRLIEKIKNPKLTVAIFYVFSGALCALTLFVVFDVQSAFLKYAVWTVTLALFAGAAASLRLYRMETLYTTIKNRRHFKLLGRFLEFMTERLKVAKSSNELVSLLETGVRDLGFDSVEVIRDRELIASWTSPQPAHPGAPRVRAEQKIDECDLTIKWARPLHKDEIYNEYLMLTWHRFLVAFKSQILTYYRKSGSHNTENVVSMTTKLNK